MSMLLVYFFVMMDSLNTGLLIGLCCAGISMIIGFCCFIDDDAPKLGRRWLKWSFPAFVLLGLLLIATPNTKQFAAIYVIPKVANNEDVRAISGDAVKMLRLKFGEWLDSLEPKKVVKEVVKVVDPTK